MEQDYIKNQFVTYEIALKLKELGFDEPCLAYYAGETLLSEFVLDYSKTVFYTQTNNGYEMSAPLYSQIIDWFRKEYGIHFNFSIYIDMDRTYYYTCDIIREMSFDKKSELTLNYSDYKDFRWRVAKKIDEIEYPIIGNRFYDAREQAILKAIKLCQTKK